MTSCSTRGFHVSEDSAWVLGDTKEGRGLDAGQVGGLDMACPEAEDMRSLS
jgi:hypothetical protein